MFPRCLTWLGVVTALLACKTVPPNTTKPSRTTSGAASTPSITADTLRAIVAEISSDVMQGRGPGTEGDRAARAYLVEKLKTIGYAPAFPQGRWEQPFSIVGVTAHVPSSWRFAASTGASVDLAFRRDFMAAAGVQRQRVSFEDAEVVFVGYGINAPEQGWNDFKGHNLRGKVLLMLNGDPDWDASLFAGKRKLYYGRWTYKYESAAAQGAAAAIIIHTTESAGYPWAVVESSWSGPQFQVPAGDEPQLPVQSWLTEDAASRLAAAGGHRLPALIAAARAKDFTPIPLGIRTSLAFDVSLRPTETANVAGILAGTDLADQVVVLSAHHDHLGLGEPDESGDTIYNGALDNGAAMAQILEIARASATLRPRRSILCLFPAAEEQGLLGSRYFVGHLPMPKESLIANINFELGNIWGRAHDVTIYGMGKSTLEDSLTSLANKQGRTTHAERDVRAGWFYRSDQFSFARVGVPAIWFRGGVDLVGREPGAGQAEFDGWIRSHYHRPTDELSAAWRFDGLVEDAMLGLELATQVASSDEQPSWYPGDEFASAR